MIFYDETHEAAYVLKLANNADMIGNRLLI